MGGAGGAGTLIPPVFPVGGWGLRDGRSHESPSSVACDAGCWLESTSGPSWAVWLGAGWSLPRGPAGQSELAMCQALRGGDFFLKNTRLEHLEG